MLAGRSDDAIAELRKGIELAPSLGIHHSILAFVYLLHGDQRKAVDEMETSVRFSDPSWHLRRSQLAYIRRRGEADKAQAIVSSLERAGRKPVAKKHVSPAALAIAYTGPTNHDKYFVAPALQSRRGTFFSPGLRCWIRPF